MIHIYYDVKHKSIRWSVSKDELELERVPDSRGLHNDPSEIGRYGKERGCDLKL
jgi:hypothetical protein